jgi:predicted acyl esterase
MRARHRDGPRQSKLIDIAEPLRYDFDSFTFVSRQICKGNRLRLVIGSLNSIYFEKNYNSGGPVSDETVRDARPVTVRIFHDESHPSALYVPIGQLGLALLPQGCASVSHQDQGLFGPVHA